MSCADLISMFDPTNQMIKYHNPQRKCTFPIIKIFFSCRKHFQFNIFGFVLLLFRVTTLVVYALYAPWSIMEYLIGLYDGNIDCNECWNEINVQIWIVRMRNRVIRFDDGGHVFYEMKYTYIVYSLKQVFSIWCNGNGNTHVDWQSLDIGIHSRLYVCNVWHAHIWRGSKYPILLIQISFIMDEDDVHRALATKLNISCINWRYHTIYLLFICQCAAYYV